MEVKSKFVLLWHLYIWKYLVLNMDRVLCIRNSSRRSWRLFKYKIMNLTTIGQRYSPAATLVCINKITFEVHIMWACITATLPSWTCWRPCHSTGHKHQTVVRTEPHTLEYGKMQFVWCHWSTKSPHQACCSGAKTKKRKDLFVNEHLATVK